jgi:5-methyltetrahydrofolate--homocysteine methyltransferase
MTETVLSSASKEVVIGFDRPFVVIGERINAVLSRREGIRGSGSPLAKIPEGAASRPGAGGCP